MKKIIALVLALCLMLSLFCATAVSGVAEAEKFGNGKNYFLTIAAPPGSSALFSFWVGIGEALSTTYSNIKPTVSESQGAVAITKSVRSGESELGNSVSATDYENYNGLGTFEGKPNKDARMLFYYEVTWEMMCVNRKEGITSVQDLNGKRFNPGGTGTSAEQIGKNIFNLLGVEPDYFTASQSDASDAYANKEIVGTIKLGPKVDSYIMQLNANDQIDIISLTDEEVAKILEAYPYLITGTIPAGTYDNIDYDATVVGTPQGCQLLKDTFTQEEQYQLCKAVMETGAEKWKNAYPVGANNDLIDLTLHSSIPLAAGTVQYLVEKGYEVPAEIIPEEYVPVQ